MRNLASQYHKFLSDKTIYFTFMCWKNTHTQNYEAYVWFFKWLNMNYNSCCTNSNHSSQDLNLKSTSFYTFCGEKLLSDFWAKLS